MEIYWDINQVKPKRDSVVTMGTFDGVHLGHQKLIQTIIDIGTERQLTSCLLTFEPHPQLVLKDLQQSQVLLTTMEEKIELLAKTGLDRLVIANFTRGFSSIEPAEFVRNILADQLGTKYLMIGHDHAFGRQRKGTYELLAKMSKTMNFDLAAFDAITINERVVSSTRIRQALAQGHVHLAQDLLGRPYTITGQVIPGDGRGKDLGFPTANIRPFSKYKLIPKAGIYATRIKIRDRWHDSATYIGVRPTFHLHDHVIEVHILGFENEIYDQEIVLEFDRYLRDDQEFSNSKELIEQIKQDIVAAKELLNH
ncbi:bifunctional riboflavin kinase/FAD synthetase [candidate division KSB1 bacterium]|nr:bifunctional riboflavin kinase/FAD synthetase [candidate division KSB1 bacterium]